MKEQKVDIDRRQPEVADQRAQFGHHGARGNSRSRVRQRFVEENVSPRARRRWRGARWATPLGAARATGPEGGLPRFAPPVRRVAGRRGPQSAGGQSRRPVLRASALPRPGPRRNHFPAEKGETLGPLTLSDAARSRGVAPGTPMVQGPRLVSGGTQHGSARAEASRPSMWDFARLSEGEGDRAPHPRDGEQRLSCPQPEGPSRPASGPRSKLSAMGRTPRGKEVSACWPVGSEATEPAQDVRTIGVSAVLRRLPCAYAWLCAYGGQSCSLRSHALPGRWDDSLCTRPRRPPPAPVESVFAPGRL